jgi:hypothetical protein
MPPQAAPAARAVRLGLLLLQEIFEVHAEARTEVLKVAQVGGTAIVMNQACVVFLPVCMIYKRHSTRGWGAIIFLQAYIVFVRV